MCSVRVEQLLCRGKTRLIWFDLIICPDNEIGSVGERGDENPRWRDQPIGRVGNFEFGSEQDNLVAGRRKLVEKFARIGSERERYKRDVRYQIVGTVAVVEGSLPVEEPVVGVGRIDKPQPRDTGRKPMRYIYISPSLKYNFSPLKIKNPKNLSSVRNKGIEQLVPGRAATTDDAHPRWKPFDNHSRHVESEIKAAGRVRLPVKLLGPRYTLWISRAWRASAFQQSNIGVQHEARNVMKSWKVIE